MKPVTRRYLILLAVLGITTSIVIWFAGLVGSIAATLLGAFLIAYLLDPVVTKFEKWKIPRWLTSAIVLLLGISIVVLGGILVLYLITYELRSFADQIPQYTELLTNKVTLIAQRFNIKLPADWQQITDFLLSKRQEILPQVANPLGKILSVAFKSTISIVYWIILLILVPVIAFYLLVSYDKMKKSLFKLVPEDLRDSVSEKITEMDKALAGFFRGQVLVCLILAVLYSIGFLWIGLELAVLVGVLGGILFIIPYLGTAVAAVLATLIALVQFGDLLHPALVIAWLIIIQIVEGNVITPNIVGGAVGLHPVVCIVAIVTGGHLFGLAGMLLAVPLTAMCKVLLLSAIDAYLLSDLYTSPPGEQG